MSCLTCDRRRLDCDALRPRCSPCRRSHVKCAYDASIIPITFQDETQSVVERSSRQKRRKTTDSPAQPSAQAPDPTTPAPVDPTAALVQNWFSFPEDTSFDFDPTITPWVDDLFEGYIHNVCEPSPSQDENDLFHMSLEIIPTQRDSEPSPSFPAPSPQPLQEHQTSPAKTEASRRATQDVPDHFLAQYYTSNLTGRYSSKDTGWNLHMHFYNRFTTSHPFVLAALYAWTSAHLHFSGAIDSLDNSDHHYERCLAEIQARTHADIGGTPSAAPILDADVTSAKLDLEHDLDAVAVALYFLASTDHVACRAEQLRRLIRFMVVLTRANYREGRDGLSVTVSCWFCFLDARASAFGTGRSALVEAMGGEPGVLRAILATRGLLQKEYRMLYPSREKLRDDAHLPLSTALSRLVALFGELSREAGGRGGGGDRSERARIRCALDEIKDVLQGIDAKLASERRILSTFLSTTALYNAVEIYYSRVCRPDDELYAADAHATAAIRAVEQMYGRLGLAKTDTPQTKMWPIPLMMAAIESRDSIYRDWSLRKMRDYDHAGAHYRHVCTLVEKIQAEEHRTGRRADIGALLRGMQPEFVI